MQPPLPGNDAVKTRWAGIDVARGLALTAMAVFHASWDLSLFGLIDVDIATAPGWRAFARLIAGSFLILVGIALVLAHGGGVRWRSFSIRLAKVAGAALAVTLATWIVFPDTFIYFGILHAIALSSVLALPFVGAPPAVSIIGASACFLAPAFLSSPVFDGPALYWLGLGTAIRPTNDYEPILPWFGFVLAGIAAARLLIPRLPALPGALADSRPARLLAFCGRHSLVFYLMHQPVLMGLVWLAAQAIGPLPVGDASFVRNCEASCRAAGPSPATCAQTCACAVDRLKPGPLWEKTARNQLGLEERREVTAAVQQCLRDAE